MEGWQELGRKLRRYIRPGTFPLAIKMVKEGESIPAEAKKPMVKMTLCKMFNASRRSGRTMVGAAAEIEDPGFVFLGLVDYTEEAWEEFIRDMVRDFIHPVMTKTAEIAEKALRALPRISPGTFSAVVVSPLEWTRVEPDFILIYGNPAQIWRLTVGVEWDKPDGAFLDARIWGAFGLCSAMAKAYLSGEAQFFLPGAGERHWSFIADDELAMVIPAAKLEEVIQGLEYTEKTGVRYPIIPTFEMVETPVPPPELKALRKLMGQA